MPLPKFNLKFLFLLTLFVAILAAASQLRPAATITVHIGPAGVQVNQIPLEKADLEAQLIEHSKYIKLWQLEPSLSIAADQETDMRDVLKIMETGQQVGIQKISMQAENE
jgi:biopolymer transport protein ExbD